MNDCIKYYDRFISTIESTDKYINLKYYNEKYDIIPNHIIKLLLHNSNNKCNNLPSSIELLDIFRGEKTNVNNLPKSLHILDIHSTYSKYKLRINNLPNNIIKIIIKNNIKLNNLPHSLKILYTFDNKYICNKLPYNLETYYTIFYNNTRLRINNLPKNIKELYLKNTINSNNFGKLTDITINSNCKINNLPHSIKYLSILGYFMDIIIKKLPLELLSFTIVSSNNHPMDNLPNKLISLTINRDYDNCNFNQPLDLLPESLLYLNLYLHTDYKYKINDLPSSIKYIVVNDNAKIYFNKMYKRKIISF